MTTKLSRNQQLIITEIVQEMITELRVHNGQKIHLFHKLGVPHHELAALKKSEQVLADSFAILGQHRYNLTRGKA